MKVYKVLKYLYAYGRDLYETDGLKTKNQNEAAQMKATAQVLKSNIELIEATAKLSTSMEQLWNNLENLQMRQLSKGDEQLEGIEDLRQDVRHELRRINDTALNEIKIRTRLMNESQLPNVVNFLRDGQGSPLEEDLGVHAEPEEEVQEESHPYFE